MDKIKVKDIMSFIEEIAPVSLAEGWDNVGLLVGDLNKPVERLLVALDVCEATLEEAVNAKVDLILTHHPFVFSGMKRIVADDVKGSQVMRLISNGVSVVSEHTNADCADAGLNVYLAKLLGTSNINSFDDTKYLRIGELPDKLDCDKFAELVKEKLNIKTVRATNVGKLADISKKIKRVAVFTGKVDLDEVLAHKSDFDVLVCGELGYHSALTLMDEGVLAFECGHFGSENIFRQLMKEMLSERFPTLEICVSEVDSDPYREI